MTKPSETYWTFFDIVVIFRDWWRTYLILFYDKYILFVWKSCWQYSNNCLFLNQQIIKITEKEKQKNKTPSKMELFARIVNKWKPLTIFTIKPILDKWLGSEYTFCYYSKHNSLNENSLGRRDFFLCHCIFFFKIKSCQIKHIAVMPRHSDILMTMVRMINFSTQTKCPPHNNLVITFIQSFTYI